MEITKYLLEQIAEISCVDESQISISAPLGDILDSLDQLELCNNIEKKYGIEIEPAKQMNQVRTIAQFIDEVHFLIETKEANEESF